MELRVYDLTGTARLGGPFDLIFCSEVIYYLGSSVGSVARRLTSVLAPGGRLVLVHQHPESEHVFQPFADCPGVRVLSSTVEADPIRPYQLLVLEKFGSFSIA